MKRLTALTLIVDDNDLECKKDRSEVRLEDIKLSSVGFVASDLDRYDMIIYLGRLGKKILRLRG